MIMRGKLVSSIKKSLPAASFNEAAHDHARKGPELLLPVHRFLRLQ